MEGDSAEGELADCENEGSTTWKANLIIDTVKAQKLRNEGCSFGKSPNANNYINSPKLV